MNWFVALFMSILAFGASRAFLLDVSLWQFIGGGICYWLAMEYLNDARKCWSVRWRWQWPLRRINS